MAVLDFFRSNFQYFGLAGSMVVILCAFQAALNYAGRKGEPYSVLNHFISELGELGVSKQARVFNGGLMVGGALLMPFFAGLGLFLPGWWARLGLAAGMWAAVSVVLVGVYPMNNLGPHGKSAISYFRAGLLAVVFFSAAVWQQPRGSGLVLPAANVFGLLSAVCYLAFLIRLSYRKVGQELKDAFDPQKAGARPKFWLLPALEWAVFFSTMLWIFCLGLAVQPA